MFTWRKNRDGTLAAAYLGACRVGYAARGTADWYWWTSLLRPEGGAYLGRSPDLPAAQEALTMAVRDWVTAAGLQLDSDVTERED